MDTDRKIRVGSRKSELALIQTNHVISLLKSIHPEKQFEIVTMSTLGDKILDIPLPKIGEKSLFTKELEAALATGCVDFVVHSLKDLPTSLPDNMAIGAVLEREDPRDALVLHKDFKDHTLESLPKGSIIGTSSLRRTAQLHRNYPQLKVENIRGNLNTRLRKLDELNKFQGIVLATAGLQRMGWNDRISKILEDDKLFYAVGQGALAVECRETDTETISLLKALYDVETAIRIIVERTFLKTLGGGCSAPVAVKTDLVKKTGCNHELSVTGAVWSLDGSNELKDKSKCDIQIKNSIYCSDCPYKGISTNSEACTKSTDIECLHTSNHKDIVVIESESKKSAQKKNSRETDTDETSEPQKSKRMKLNSDNHHSDNFNILSDVDPHDKCPIHLPIGADFMGKCPYLETHTISKCPVSGYVEGMDKLNIDKCPYMKDGQVIMKTEDNPKETLNQNLFCGLVPHPDVSVDTFKQAENLGKELAEKLISKGAIDIMAKAQAIIRSN